MAHTHKNAAACLGPANMVLNVVSYPIFSLRHFSHMHVQDVGAYIWNILRLTEAACCVDQASSQWSCLVQQAAREGTDVWQVCWCPCWAKG